MTDVEALEEQMRRGAQTVDRWLIRIVSVVLAVSVVAVVFLWVSVARADEYTARTRCERTAEYPRLQTSTVAPYYWLNGRYTVACHNRDGYTIQHQTTVAWVRAARYGVPWRIWSDARTGGYNNCNASNSYCYSEGRHHEPCDAETSGTWTYQLVVLTKVSGNSVWGPPFTDTYRWYSYTNTAPCGGHQ